MKKLMFFVAVAMFFNANSASAIETQKIERNDPTCENSMRIIKKKFGTPDEIFQLSSNSISMIFRGKAFLHTTFEISGNSCIVTISDF